MLRKIWFGTSKKSLSKAEQGLVDRIGVEDYEMDDVIIDENETIHVLKVGEGEPLLLFHGYGAGCLFFWKILKALAEKFTVFACDMPGMGMSSRPKWKAKTREEAEDFFIERFELLRKALNLSNFTLAGHSMGGYLSALYAQRYPNEIKKLVLLSPVGIPRGDPKKLEEFIKSASWGRRQVLKVLKSLWDKNASPFSIVRGTGRVGRVFMKRYASRRMGEALDKDEQKALAKYMYEYTTLKGSGEYALGQILSAGAFAHSPLIDRIEDFEMPVSIFYGDHDWMDPQGGRDLIEKIKQKGEVYYISDAGHHMYIDNPGEFIDAFMIATGHAESELTYEIIKNYAPEQTVEA